MLPLLSRTDRKKLKVFSLAVLALSLLVPTFWDYEMRGIQVLTLGWISWLSGDLLAAISWLAYPLAFLSVIVPSDFRKMRFFLVALAFFFSFLAVFIRQIPLNDHGLTEHVLPGFGVVLWLFGLMGLSVYHFQRLRSKKRKRRHKH